jgi:hypothetical protein
MRKTMVIVSLIILLLSIVEIFGIDIAWYWNQLPAYKTLLF